MFRLLAVKNEYITMFRLSQKSDIGARSCVTFKIQRSSSSYEQRKMEAPIVPISIVSHYQLFMTQYMIVCA